MFLPSLVNWIPVNFGRLQIYWSAPSGQSLHVSSALPWPARSCQEVLVRENAYVFTFPLFPRETGVFFSSSDSLVTPTTACLTGHSETQSQMSQVLSKMGAPPKNSTIPTLDAEMVGKLNVSWLNRRCWLILMK